MPHVFCPWVKVRSDARVTNVCIIGRVPIQPTDHVDLAPHSPSPDLPLNILTRDAATRIFDRTSEFGLSRVRVVRNPTPRILAQPHFQ